MTRLWYVAWLRSVGAVVLLICTGIPTIVQATTIISASTAVNLSAQAPDGADKDDDDSASCATGDILCNVATDTISVSASTSVDFDGSYKIGISPPTFEDRVFGTTWSGSADAVASTTTAGVSTSMTLTDFNPLIVGSGINQNANTFYFDEFDAAGFAGSFFISPIFDLTGTVFASSTTGIDTTVRMTMNFFSTTHGAENFIPLFFATAPADGSTLIVSENVAPATDAFAVMAGDAINVTIRLSTEINVNFSSLAAGDHSASIDFIDTATLLGWSVWEDAEMTQALTGVTLTRSGTGETIPIFDPSPDPTPVPEPGTLGLLGAGLFGLWMRRKTT